LAQLQGFAAIGGSTAFAGRPHGQGLRGRGANDHNIDGPSAVISVGKDDVSTFKVVVVRWDHLFTMDGDVSPVVDNFVEGVCHGFVPLHRSSTIGAAQGMMPFGVAVTGTAIAICALERAGAGPENVISKAHTDGEIENFIRHKVRRLRRELEPGSAVRPAARLTPGGKLG
jgi:hypothetical protein